MVMPAASTPARQHDPTSIRSDDLLSVVRSLYAELHRSSGDFESITLDSTLERDLGFDSLARAELLLRLEQHFRVNLPDNTLESVETVADLVNAVASANKPASTPGEAHPAVPVIAPPIPSARSLGLPSHAATLNEVLEWRAQTAPDAIHAIVLGETGPEPLSYAQLQEGAHIVAGGLIRAGIQAGSTVALMLPTSKGYLHAFFGAMLAGAIPVPIYPPTRPLQLEEHVHRHAGILSNAAADTLVTFQEAGKRGKRGNSPVTYLSSVD